MKVTHTFGIFLALVSMLPTLLSQNQLEIDGDAKITGRLELGSSNLNTIIGITAGIDNTGFYNAFYGHEAGYHNTTASQNSFYGHRAGFHNLLGGSNSFFGDRSGFSNTSGFHNSFFGASAGSHNTEGYQNSFFGHLAGYYNTTGLLNVFVGLGTGLLNDDGSFNTFVGAQAGRSNKSGTSNSFLGASAGTANSTGSYNSFLGNQAGLENTIGSYNTAVGYNAQVGTTLDHAIALGFNASVGCSNCCVIGGEGVDAVNVGIGVTNPTEALHTLGNIRADNGEFQSWGAIVLHPDVDNSGDDNILFVNSLGVETMRVNNNGKVGIGLSNPQEVLHTIGNIRADNGEFQSGGNIVLHPDVDNTGDDVVRFVNSLGSENMRVNSDGKIGVRTSNPGSELHIKQAGVSSNNGIRLEPSTSTNFWNVAVVGNDLHFYYNNTDKGYVDNGTAGFVNPSDKRLKTNIQEMDAVLDKVMKLKPSTYHFKGTDQSTSRNWGFIAQEVEAVFPEIVLQSGEYKGLAYDNFAILAIKAIQEQQQIIEKQQKMLDRQQNILEQQQSNTLHMLLQIEELNNEMKMLASKNSYTKK